MFLWPVCAQPNSTVTFTIESLEVEDQLWTMRFGALWFFRAWRIPGGVWLETPEDFTVLESLPTSHRTYVRFNLTWIDNKVFVSHSLDPYGAVTLHWPDLPESTMATCHTGPAKANLWSFNGQIMGWDLWNHLSDPWNCPSRHSLLPEPEHNQWHVHGASAARSFTWQDQLRCQGAEQFWIPTSEFMGSVILWNQDWHPLCYTYSHTSSALKPLPCGL